MEEMSMKFKHLTLFVVLLLLAAFVVACTGGETAVEEGANTEAEAPVEEEAAPAEEEAEAPAEEEAAAGEPFVVGILGPFTGPSARNGEEFRISAEMAFEAIDYNICDTPIEVIYVDSQSDPEKASRAYEEAIVQQGMQAGAINWHSSVAAAVMEITAKYQVPHFFGFGATEVVNEKFASDQEKYGYWAVKGWPTPDKLSQNYVSALEEAIELGEFDPGEEKVAAIYGEDTDWGRSFGEGIAGQLEAAGWNIVDRQYFPLEQTEFYALLNRFKEQEVDLIAGTSTSAPSLSAFIKQADEVGLGSLIIADGLGWVGEWYELTGEASNYVIDQIPGWTTEAALAFVEDFKAKSGLDPSPSSAGLAFDGTNFFIKVLQAACEDYGSLSSENVMNVVREKVWTGELVYTAEDGAIVMSEYNFSEPPDPLVGAGYYTFPVLQYFDGQPVTIWPPEFKQDVIKTPEN
jgi:branched-chain amino acid transport system substrate-binding protein